MHQLLGQSVQLFLRRLAQGTLGVENQEFGALPLAFNAVKIPVGDQEMPPRKLTGEHLRVRGHDLKS